MTKTAETASVAETETVPTMPGLPLSGATETVLDPVKLAKALKIVAAHTHKHRIHVGPLTVARIVTEYEKL